MEEKFNHDQINYERVQIVNQEDVKIVSKIDSIVKVARNTTVVQYRTIEIKGVIKTPNHYKYVNVVIDDLPENQHCKDIVIKKIFLGFESPRYRVMD